MHNNTNIIIRFFFKYFFELNFKKLYSYLKFILKNQRAYNVLKAFRAPNFVANFFFSFGAEFVLFQDDFEVLSPYFLLYIFHNQNQN